MSTASRTDLVYRITYDPQFVPEQSLYINVKTMLVKGEPAYIMKNHLTGAYYTLGDLAYQVWNLIDGKRTMAQIAEEMKSVGNVLAVLAAKRSLLFFAEHNCLQSTVELPKEKRLRVISAFEIRVNILNRSKNALESIHRVVHPLLRRPLLWISLAFIVACALVFSGRFVTIFRTKEFFAIPIGEQSSSVVGFFFYFFAVLLPIITVHEIAHGLALVHYGGAPKEIGTGLFYFGPMFYINTTDAWMLPRRQRIMVFLAGPLSTLLIGSALVVLTFLGPVPAGFIDRVPIMTAFFCFYLTLSNLAPPFETDGYYVLMDLVNNPYLRQEAYRYVKTLFLRLLRKSVEEESESFTGKKRVLLAYFTLSVGWIIYLIYQSLQVLVYMTEDVVDAVFNMGSVIFLNQAITLATTTVAIASIAYFGMTVAGYGVMVVAAVRKVFVKALPFQAIHDRDLSVFLHLPTQASKFLVNALKDRMRKVARKFTLNYDIESMGTQCSAVLHIGGTRLALVQIREYLGKVEEAFYSMYRDFLHDHEIELFKSVGIRHSQEKNLTALLEQVGDELASSGRPEAKAIVNQIITRNSQTVHYLLSSAFGKVWTIELPPTQQEEILKTMLPTFYVEDLAVTDLYDETEEFKKRVIYGFDSLAQLATQNQKEFKKILEQSDKYQVVCLYEPVRSRLLFIGRTEEFEEDLPAFGPLFLSQAWSSYLDSVLTEANYALSTLRRASFPNEDAIQALKDGELSVLKKNLDTFNANASLLKKSLTSSKKQVQQATNSLKELKKRLQPMGAFKVGLLDAIFKVNTENLRSLPKQLEKFRRTFNELSNRINEISESIEKERKNREAAILKRKLKAFLTYPLVAATSTILILIGLQTTNSITALPFLASPFLLHAAFTIYYIRLRKRHLSAGRYPSSAFHQIQLFTLALTQTIYSYAITGNILAQSKSKDNRASATRR